jgi:hypothetical protein
MIKTVKYNKQQKEDIENRLRQLNKNLSTLKGEAYKKTLAEQQQLKTQQQQQQQELDEEGWGPVQEG